MSFDIQANNGDIQFSIRNDIEKVTDSNKLAQDVIKILNTTLGSDPLNPSYGSMLTASAIGSTPNSNVVTIQVQQSLEAALEKLMELQEIQRSYQILTDAETIVEFGSPIVEQDSTDPRQYNIIINAISQDLTPITLEMAIVL